MTKRKIDWDEYYPVFMLTPGGREWVELSDEEVARVDAADAEWLAVQELLLARLRESGNTRF